MNTLYDTEIVSIYNYKNIDTDAKAYLISLILLNISKKRTSDKKLYIEIKCCEYINISDYINTLKLEKIIEIIPNDEMLEECNNYVSLTVHEDFKTILRDHFKASFDEKNYLITYDIDYFIKNYDKKYVNEFMRAYYESNHSTLEYKKTDDWKPLLNNLSLYYCKDADCCVICNIYDKNNNVDMLKTVAEYFNIPYKIFNNKYQGDYIEYSGTNAIDFLGTIYEKEASPKISKFRYNEFKELLNKKFNPVINFMKISDDAITPSKAHYSDAGFDLSIINIKSEINSKTKLYNTGIKVEIPLGYYMEIVPRSSINKSGYMLSNSIGIIDTSYRGELFVSLTKIDEASADIVLPYKCAQLILRKQEYPELIEVSSFKDGTKRNEGGFGSSGI